MVGTICKPMVAHEGALKENNNKIQENCRILALYNNIFVASRVLIYDLL